MLVHNDCPGVSSGTIELEQQAKELNGNFSEFAQRFRTTVVGVGKDSNGNPITVVGTSLNYSPSAIKNALADSEIFAKPTCKAHAEIHVLIHALTTGVWIDSIAASRPVCKDCAEVLAAFGVDILSPLK